MAVARSHWGLPGLQMPPGSITVEPDFVRPGRSVGNAFIEAFNGRLGDECPNVHQFASIADAQAKIEARRLDYNQRHTARSAT
jgi:transposase InsO family protein